MTAPGTRPIEDHVAALGASLHGPARVKARMMQEVRDGLADAASALAAGAREEGGGDGRAPGERAARRAVRDFGAVEEVAPSFQRELTLAQARHTACAVALAVPLLLGCWYLAGAAHQRLGGPLPQAAQVLAAHVGGVAVAAALLAAAALAATGALARRLSVPHRLPLVVAWAGTIAGMALGAGALTLTLASALSANWPLGALAGALTVVTHVKVAASARACRRCARLPAA